MYSWKIEHHVHVQDNEILKFACIKRYLIFDNTHLHIPTKISISPTRWGHFHLPITNIVTFVHFSKLLLVMIFRDIHYIITLHHVLLSTISVYCYQNLDTSLRAASREGHLHIVRLLLHRRAVVDSRDEVRQPLHEGDTVHV